MRTVRCQHGHAVLDRMTEFDPIDLLLDRQTLQEIELRLVGLELEIGFPEVRSLA